MGEAIMDRIAKPARRALLLLAALAPLGGCALADIGGGPAPSLYVLTAPAVESTPGAPQSQVQLVVEERVPASGPSIDYASNPCVYVLEAGPENPPREPEPSDPSEQRAEPEEAKELLERIAAARNPHLQKDAGGNLLHKIAIPNCTAEEAVPLLPYKSGLRSEEVRWDRNERLLLFVKNEGRRFFGRCFRRCSVANLRQISSNFKPRF